MPAPRAILRTARRDFSLRKRTLALDDKSWDLKGLLRV
jgi:hypothetical protein